jgi:hypothetical protein
MMPNDGANSERNMDALRAAASVLDIRPYDLWLAYFALGGNALPNALAGWLAGKGAPGHVDYCVLAVAVNEALTDLGLDQTVPSSLEVDNASG